MTRAATAVRESPGEDRARRPISASNSRLDRSTLARLAVLAGIPAVAFALRAAWLVRPGTAWTFGPDSYQYVALSKGLVHGCGFAYWLGDACGKPDVFRTPLYPAFLTLFGGAWRVVIGSQALLGALTCALVAVFVMNRFGLAAAAFAAGVLAIDVPSIFITRELRSDPLCQLVLTAGVLLCVSRCLFARRFRNYLLCAAGGGMLVALAVLARPAAVAAVPILLVPVLLLARKTWAKWISTAALVVVVPLAIVSAWVVRNYRETGVATLSTTGALNLYLSSDLFIPKESTNPGSLPTRSTAAVYSASGSPRCIGVGGLRVYDLTMCSVTSDPTIARGLFRRARSVLLGHPVETILLSLEGFVRLCVWPHVPGLPDGRPALFQWSGQSALAEFAIWLIAAFEFAILCLIWVGVGKAVWQSYRAGMFSDDAILTWSLLGVGLLLLLPPSLFFYNWQTRYRCLSIPFLAIVGAIGWFSRADGEQQKTGIRRLAGNRSRPIARQKRRDDCKKLVVNTVDIESARIVPGAPGGRVEATISAVGRVIKNLSFLFGECEGAAAKARFCRYAAALAAARLANAQSAEDSEGALAESETFLRLKRADLWFDSSRGSGELWSYIEVYSQREYDSERVRIEPGDVIFDIGANLGTFAIRYGREYPANPVFCFEPNPKVYKRLERNLEANRLGNAIVINAAVAECAGERAFYVGRATVTGSLIGAETAAPVFCTEVTDLDSFCAARSIGSIGLLKIDVEGAEVAVLDGANRALRNTKALMIESHSPALEESVRSILAARGFQTTVARDYLYGTRVVHFFRS